MTMIYWEYNQLYSHTQYFVVKDLSVWWYSCVKYTLCHTLKYKELHVGSNIQWLKERTLHIELSRFRAHVWWQRDPEEALILFFNTGLGTEEKQPKASQAMTKVCLEKWESKIA